MNSDRVADSSGTPRALRLVVHMLSALRMPRIDMHVCDASSTTPTPCASSSCITRSAMLLGHPLLNLRPGREDLHDPGQLAEPDDPAIRQIGDMGLAEKG